MANYNYKQEIENMVDNYIEDTLDAWQCVDWGVDVSTFMDELGKAFIRMCNKLAEEIAEEDEAEEEE